MKLGTNWGKIFLTATWWHNSVLWHYSEIFYNWIALKYFLFSYTSKFYQKKSVQVNEKFFQLVTSLFLAQMCSNYENGLLRGFIWSSYQFDEGWTEYSCRHKHSITWAAFLHHYFQFELETLSLITHDPSPSLFSYTDLRVEIKSQLKG